MHVMLVPRLLGVGRRLRADRRGLALLEFALTLPLILGVGLYGLETANLALANMRVSQAALNSAGLTVQQLREIDMNDVLAQVREQTKSWQLTTRGRVTISSLEADASGNQVIHWQRCIGLKRGAGYDSSYGRTRISGTTPAGAESTAAYDPTAGVNTASSGDNSATHPGSSTSGMGVTGAKVTAPPSSGVIFVEINYDYLPVISGAWLPGGAVKLHYIASFIVRDRRDFSQIYNPVTTPATQRATCDLYAA
jgi:hypothetical protein